MTEQLTLEQAALNVADMAERLRINQEKRAELDAHFETLFHGHVRLVTEYEDAKEALVQIAKQTKGGR